MNVLALMGLEMMMIWSSLMMGETTIVHPMILCSSMCMLLCGDCYGYECAEDGTEDVKDELVGNVYVFEEFYDLEFWDIAEWDIG